VAQKSRESASGVSGVPLARFLKIQLWSLLHGKFSSKPTFENVSSLGRISKYSAPYSKFSSELTFEIFYLHHSPVLERTDLKILRSQHYSHLTWQIYYMVNLLHGKFITWQTF